MFCHSPVGDSCRTVTNWKQWQQAYEKYYGTIFSEFFFSGRGLSECAAFQFSIRRLFAFVRPFKFTVQRKTGTTKFQMPLLRLLQFTTLINNIALYCFVNLQSFVWLSLFPEYVRYTQSGVFPATEGLLCVLVRAGRGLMSCNKPA